MSLSLFPQVIIIDSLCYTAVDLLNLFNFEPQVGLFRSRFEMSEKERQAGAELCQAQLKLGIAKLAGLLLVLAF